MGVSLPVFGMDKMAVGQNQWYHFGVGAPPILVYFSGDWDVHCKYGWPYYLNYVASERLVLKPSI